MRRPGRMPTLLTLIFCWTAGFSDNAGGKEVRELVFDGGPSGGTYTIFAEGMAEVLNREIPSVRVVVEPSGGSIVNLMRVDSGEIDMAIAVAGDIERGKEGLLEEYPHPLANVAAVCRLFGQHAHLMVLQQGRIKTLADLAGARVAVGARGSGTLAAAQRFFQSVGLWDKIRPDYASFDLVVSDFISGQIEAVWQLVGYPSPSLEEIGRKTPVRLIDLGKEARESGFLGKYPSYSPGVIPAGTYPGVDYDVETFQDQAIWVASKNVDDEFIFQALTHLFSPAGLKHMKIVHPVARQLNPAEAAKGVGIPFHPGAQRFWKSRR